MTQKTFAHGTLTANTDNWLLVGEDVIVLDLGALANLDGSLENQSVSVVGTRASVPQVLRSN